nr:hypothetical protein [Tanacetum cinerariifolium]
MREIGSDTWDRGQGNIGCWGESFGTIQVSCRCTGVAVSEDSVLAGFLVWGTVVYNRRTKKIMKTMNVTFDELSVMAFEQSSSKPGLHNTAPIPTNSSSQATNFPNSLQDVDGLKTQQQHAHRLGNQAPLQPKTVADNVPNAMFDENSFVNPFANLSTSVVESSSSQCGSIKHAYVLSTIPS